MGMAAIVTRCIVTIFLVYSVCCCNCQSDGNPSVCSSWTKLQISPDPFTSMEYGNFFIDIYEHTNNKKSATAASEKKYFYSPIGLLDNQSAVSTYNRITKQPEMRFRIEMWNDKVQKQVVKYLSEIVGHEIKSNKVRVIPLEKFILKSKRPTVDYSLPEWTKYEKSKTLRISLSCYDQKFCDEMASEMRSVPEHFDHFELFYSLSSEASHIKQATINVDSVTSGQMVTRLLQKFGGQNEVFLSNNDERKMLTEMANKIQMNTFADSEVGSSDAEIIIYSFLKDLLVMSRTTIKEQSDEMWNSVFWNEDNYRPDRTTRILNEIVNKLSTETRKKLADMFQKVVKQTEKSTSSNKGVEKRREVQFNLKQMEKWELVKNQSDELNRTFENKEKFHHNYDSNSWTDVDTISLTISREMANDSDSSGRVEISKEDVKRLLQESKNHVQWDEEKFVPKPMQLSQINLGKFSDSQSFQDRNVRVRYTNAELSASIKFVEHAELTVTDEWNNLKEELKDTVMTLVKTNTELGHLKTDVIDLTNKSEACKQELMKTKTELENNFSKNVRDLSTKLNSTGKELREDIIEIKTSAGKLSTELKVYVQRFSHELKEVEDNLRKDLSATLDLMETTQTNLTSTRMELGNTKSAVDNLTSQLNDRTSEIVDIGKMPTSCSDLQRMGHKLSGFYSVKGSKKKMEMVYCDFYTNRNDKQKTIGYADIKSAPVYFHVQRNTTSRTINSPIPFEFARVNEGNTMNITSGKFTAPLTGIYFFSITGIWYNTSLRFYLNGNPIGRSQGYGGSLSLTFQSTLNLKKDDQIWVQIEGNYLADDGNHHTHFTGLMLEEELADFAIS
ncbi:uncharacterized protein LOC124190774 [Daphnia pulex]|uniref:uncharacterized protein LOC124190774 n=1 Tax=Daphnia pulex TaxID=6669 RepID=UPI001EDD4F4B|nr:uncharacterized protein LOC124190774 [Daphnia pulex]